MSRKNKNPKAIEVTVNRLGDLGVTHSHATARGGNHAANKGGKKALKGIDGLEGYRATHHRSLHELDGYRATHHRAVHGMDGYRAVHHQAIHGFDGYRSVHHRSLHDVDGCACSEADTVVTMHGLAGLEAFEPMFQALAAQSRAAAAARSGIYGTGTIPPHDARAVAPMAQNGVRLPNLPLPATAARAIARLSRDPQQVYTAMPVTTQQSGVTMESQKTLSPRDVMTAEGINAIGRAGKKAALVGQAAHAQAEQLERQMRAMARRASAAKDPRQKAALTAHAGVFARELLQQRVHAARAVSVAGAASAAVRFHRAAAVSKDPKEKQELLGKAAAAVAAGQQLARTKVQVRLPKFLTKAGLRALAQKGGLATPPIGQNLVRPQGGPTTMARPAPVVPTFQRAPYVFSGNQFPNTSTPSPFSVQTPPGYPVADIRPPAGQYAQDRLPVNVPTLPPDPRDLLKPAIVVAPDGGQTTVSLKGMDGLMGLMGLGDDVFDPGADAVNAAANPAADSVETTTVADNSVDASNILPADPMTADTGSSGGFWSNLDIGKVFDAVGAVAKEAFQPNGVVSKLIGNSTQGKDVANQVKAGARANKPAGMTIAGAFNKLPAWALPATALGVVGLTAWILL